MDKEANSTSRDETAALLLPALARRGIACAWAANESAESAVRAECQALADDHVFVAEMDAYLANNPIIVRSCESMLAQLAFAAGVRWQDSAAILHPLARRGWHIARWLPTFLLIDGPLGRLLRSSQSPLCQRLRGRASALPLLRDARDAFNANLFRLVRNGFAHWSFEWDASVTPPEIKVLDSGTGLETAKLTLVECEALHFLAMSVVRPVDELLLRRHAWDQRPGRSVAG